MLDLLEYTQLTPSTLHSLQVHLTHSKYTRLTPSTLDSLQIHSTHSKYTRLTLSTLNSLLVHSTHSEHTQLTLSSLCQCFLCTLQDRMRIICRHSKKVGLIQVQPTNGYCWGVGGVGHRYFTCHSSVADGVGIKYYV